MMKLNGPMEVEIIGIQGIAVVMEEMAGTEVIELLHRTLYLSRASSSAIWISADVLNLIIHDKFDLISSF